MNIVSISTENSDLGLKPLGNRLYELTNPINVRIEFDNKLVYLYSFTTEFITNFRSGSPIIDTFTDQIGDSLSALAYLIHDSNYTPCHYLFDKHPLPKDQADRLLYSMLVYGGMNRIKAKIIYESVNLFGHDAYYNDDELTDKNKLSFAFYRKVI